MATDPVTQPRTARDREALALFLDVSRSFHALVDVDELLRLVCARLKDLLQAEACSVILYDAAHGELYFPVVEDERLVGQNPLRDLRFPADRGISGWVLREGRSVLIPDVSRDPRFYEGIDRTVGTRTRSLICAPLPARSGPLGVAQVINKKEGRFTEEDLAFLDAIAGSVAIALENARAYESLRRDRERAQHENQALRRELASRFKGIVGASPALGRVLEQALLAAPTRATVTLLGESGTGKELVARAIHEASDRAHGPFVAVNCGAIPAGLVEAELFGHERGAFTGAVAARRGRFEVAHGGTLFLDEIGDLELSLQAKLLRALQQGEIHRVGSEQPRHVDVRLVTATNRDLQALVAAGRFREDLYWRINVITLELPPLRERREDLPLLVRHFLAHFSRELGKPTLALDPAAEAALLGYAYPGNVRELENLVQRAVILARGPLVTVAELPPRVLVREGAPEPPAPQTNEDLKAAKAEAGAAAEQAVERRFLLDLLRRTHGNVSEAARLAGMNRSWLHQMLSRHRLDPHAFR